MLQVARPRTWGNAPRLAPVAMGRIVAQLLPDNMAMARFTSMSRAASLRGGVVRVHGVSVPDQQSPRGNVARRCWGAGDRGKRGLSGDRRLLAAGGIRGGPWTERPHAAAWPVRPPLPGRHLKGWNGRLNSRSLRFVRVWGASHVPAVEGRGEVEDKVELEAAALGAGSSSSASQACGTAASETAAAAAAAAHPTPSVRRQTVPRHSLPPLPESSATSSHHQHHHLTAARSNLTSAPAALPVAGSGSLTGGIGRPLNCPSIHHSSTSLALVHLVPLFLFHDSAHSLSSFHLLRPPPILRCHRHLLRLDSSPAGVSNTILGAARLDSRRRPIKLPTPPLRPPAAGVVCLLRPRVRAGPNTTYPLHSTGTTSSRRREPI
ncbi:hypothetical protein PCL_03153 [Purpureocillium lilacinum]|uniref:Uncharacterized protein n=1 Tax=Purpureocillium lilacinum TaxID=33203 RepID=A0A2U3DYP8_PURLI|nr:hypothetical protein Purlil1_594 [Purpureocillium lilacinum]PWI67385.1 hypothetical protein PCL_03153 [Purpureocillium lilacinum]